MQVVFTKHGSALPREVHETLLYNLVSGLKANHNPPKAINPGPGTLNPTPLTQNPEP